MIVRRTSTHGSGDGSAIRRRVNARIGTIFGSFPKEPMEACSTRKRQSSAPGGPFDRRKVRVYRLVSSLIRPGASGAPAASRVGEGPARRPHGNRTARRGADRQVPIPDSPAKQAAVEEDEEAPRPVPERTGASRIGRLFRHGRDWMKKDFRKTLSEEV